MLCCASWAILAWRLPSALWWLPLSAVYCPAPLDSWELLELLSLPEVARLEYFPCSWAAAAMQPWTFIFECSKDFGFLFRFLSKLCMLNLLLTEKVAVLAGDFFLLSNLCSITLICYFSSKDSIRGGLWPFVKACWTIMAWSCVSYIFPAARFSSNICLGPLLKTQLPSVAHLCSSAPSSNRMGSASKKTLF